MPSRRNTELLPPDRAGPPVVRLHDVVVRRAPEAGSLAGGMLVEASIVARLLRIRLLTLDASVLVVPATAEPPAPPATRPREQAAPRAPGPRSTPTGSSRRRLAVAIRRIDECDALLARARDNRALLDGR